MIQHDRLFSFQIIKKLHLSRILIFFQQSFSQDSVTMMSKLKFYKLVVLDDEDVRKIALTIQINAANHCTHSQIID